MQKKKYEDVSIGKYEHMINMKRPRSGRSKMPVSDRAAQFLPYAPLKGHDAAIEKKAKEIRQRREVELVDEDII